MLYSCNRIATVGVKGLKSGRVQRVRGGVNVSSNLLFFVCGRQVRTNQQPSLARQWRRRHITSRCHRSWQTTLRTRLTLIKVTPVCWRSTTRRVASRLRPCALWLPPPPISWSSSPCDAPTTSWRSDKTARQAPTAFSS